MNVKNILYEYENINGRIQKLNKELNQYIVNKSETYNTLKAARITGLPKSTDISNQTLDAVERIADRYDTQIKYIIKRINELMDMKETIDETLKCLSVEEFEIIELRYFYKCYWNRIAREVHYSRAQCFRKHDEAIIKIEKKLNMRLNETKKVV